jgi:hypothetical protein
MSCCKRSLLALVFLLGLMGCGNSTEPVQKTEPLPKNRFPHIHKGEPSPGKGQPPAQSQKPS